MCMAKDPCDGLKETEESIFIVFHDIYTNPWYQSKLRLTTMLSALVKSVQHLQDNLLYPTRENEQIFFCFCFTGQFYDSD
jgi:hypothetical protein